MATTIRRKPIRQPPKFAKAEPLNADELADALATKLTLSGVKGKTKQSDEDSKAQAMRSVNEASQALSGVVQSGWKRSSGDASRTTLATVTATASRAAKGLSTLRRIRSDQLDVERAAGSVLGKLMALEMYDLAASALSEMQPRLCILLKVTDEPSNSISIPEPSLPPTDPVLLNLVSIYLLYAIVIKAQAQNTIDEFSNILVSPSTRSLLSWLPWFNSLPSKHTDSLLTRTYTVLIKLCSSSSTSSTPPTGKARNGIRPESLFILRTYAMRCLIHASPGTIEAANFWDQVTRFAVSFAKVTSQKAEEKVASMVMHAYGELVRIAEQRSDREQFLGVSETGRGFLGFCEHWTGFAKMAGDISTLQKINSFMQQASSSSSSLSLSPLSPESGTRTAQQEVILEGTKVYNSFSQMTVLFEETEKRENELLGSAQGCIELMRTSTSLSILLREHTRPPTTEKRSREEGELSRISGKVDRALEKLRRHCLKFLEANPVSVSSSSLACALDDALRRLLSEIVCRLHDILSSFSDLNASSTRDFLTRSIDTLFILARTKLNVTNPQTFVPAFEHLSLAVTILDTVPTSRFPLSPVDESVDIANYIRCISGAFYNLAGSLYQAMRFGSAVPFLVESCKLGGKALSSPRSQPIPINEAREKEWAQLEEQLYRRWELLGVCYSKNADRKNAYDAFKQAIQTFPFSSSGLPTQSGIQAPAALFDPSSSNPNTSIKPLVALVDRVSYIGACELLLPPDEVSLLSTVIRSPGRPSPNSLTVSMDAGTAGALLERQLDSLEPSRWKESVRNVFLRLLADALQIYKVDGHAQPSDWMPVRRARILVRCMEFAYRDQHEQQGKDACTTLGFESVEKIAEEVERLATMESLGRDVELSTYIPQYRVSAHLWVALHSHRRASSDQHVIMTQRVEEVCRIITDSLVQGTRAGVTPKSSTRKNSSPKIVTKRATTSTKIVSPKRTRGTVSRSRRAPAEPPAAPKKATSTRNAKTNKINKAFVDPVTPKLGTRGVLLPVSTNVTSTPPRRSLEGSFAVKSTALVFDNFDKFLSLLLLCSRILGFLSLILPKTRLLDLTRKLAQRHAGMTSDGNAIASLDLAHQYVTLGKMKRATSVFTPALETVRTGQTSDEVAVRFLLHFAEYLAVIEDVPKSSNVYLEALQISRRLDLEQKGLSTQQRIHARTRILELAALASHVFGLIQYAKGDTAASLEGLLQSLRLWNRAADALTRVSPAQSQAEPDPFGTANEKGTLPLADPGSSKEPVSVVERRSLDRRPIVEDLEWRVSEGLLSTLFTLTQAYFLRGSAREAEYFARQAADLAEQLNAPGMLSRAFARQGEVQLHMGLFDDTRASLMKATTILKDIPGIEIVDAYRLRAECETRTLEEQNVQQTFDESVAMLEELDNAFQQLDGLVFGPRKSSAILPGRKDFKDVLAPELFASLLSRRLWLLRDDVGEAFNSTLEKLLSLSFSSRSKADGSALLGRLTLHGVYGRFRNDMFLSSLTESTIAVPLGMSGEEHTRISVATKEVIDALASAEDHFWAHLRVTTSMGEMIKGREAAAMLVLISAFRISLGDKRLDVPTIMAGLLDCSAALTLRRDMLDAINYKFPSHCLDDLQWPLLSNDGTSLPRIANDKPAKFRLSPTPESDDDDDAPDTAQRILQNYWNSIRDKYRTKTLDPSVLSASETSTLPHNWTIVNIAVTPDRSTLFISRQQGGLQNKDPLVFCIPMKGRRDNGGGGEDEDHLSFEGAIEELKDIISASDECTKAAINIKANDEETRSNWWKTRGQLDVRMRELLENIEYCWLGAFKTILSPRSNNSPAAIAELRSQFEKVFHRCLRVKDKKPKSKVMHTHRKTSSAHMPTPSPDQFTLDYDIVECFSTLSPRCRDEELEDLVYFVLDLYQFHGVPVAIAEVDIDQVVVDLRTALEEYSAKLPKENKSEPTDRSQDEHLFLVLDKNVQGFPWESIPILRGRSVSRIPGVQFLHDRIAYAKLVRGSTDKLYEESEGAVVDPKKGFFILNPSGDLSRTEERFRDWATSMKKSGWDGVIGQKLSEQQFVNALRTQDLVVYFGHGGGEQYVRSHKIRSLPTCAAAMLWGCSSGALRDMGDFDRTGTPYNYMLAGCPTLVANLWDVTDKDIDKFSQAVFEKIGLSGRNVDLFAETRPRAPTSVVAAVAQSRDCCKLKYLTGAAPVVYGIPFYI